MSGKVANYSGALQKSDKTTLVAVPADSASRNILSPMIGRECVIVDKVLSSPPHCTLWYYISFVAGSPEFAVTRDMLK